jgi:hypothetical protein
VAAVIEPGAYRFVIDGINIDDPSSREASPKGKLPKPKLLMVTFRVVEEGPMFGRAIRNWYRASPDAVAVRCMEQLVRAAGIATDPEGGFHATELVGRVIEADVVEEEYLDIDPMTGYSFTRRNLRLANERQAGAREDIDAVMSRILGDEVDETVVPWPIPTNNQGRVRSDNVAPYEEDGLRFRSLPEVYFYRALKRLEVTFAPLAVFVRGGDEQRRIEPDFIIYRDGLLLAVEIDGPQHNEAPAEIARRTAMFTVEGAVVEHVTADDCGTETLARATVERLLHIFDR